MEAATDANANPDMPHGELPKSEYAEAAATGQAYEAEFLAGVENAPPADVAEVHTHGETEQLAPEETVEPEIAQTEEQAREEQD